MENHVSSFIINIVLTICGYLIGVFEYYNSVSNLSYGENYYFPFGLFVSLICLMCLLMLFNNFHKEVRLSYLKIVKIHADNKEYAISKIKDKYESMIIKVKESEITVKENKFIKIIFLIPSPVMLLIWMLVHEFINILYIVILTVDIINLLLFLIYYKPIILIINTNNDEVNLIDSNPDTAVYNLL